MQVTDKTLLKDSRQLPDHLKGSIVLLRFAEPIPRIASHHFVRVRLSEKMLRDGESKAYRSEIVQPHRTGKRKCRICDRPRDEIDESTQVCGNPQCELFSKPVSCGTLQGVIKVLIAKDFEEPDGRLNAVGLILDRRYNEQTLAAIYRTAGMLCDQMGWSLK